MKFELNWSGKQYAKKESYTQSEFSLIPDKNDSKNWDTTQNLYIEGDNLEVLKVLQNSYQNRVKMIYIDPPYNTGKDFVYKDNYRYNIENYLSISGQKNEFDNRMNVNVDTNGRYHVNWLNMMYPRLKVAKDLLTEDGVIFISIDDNEIDNLREIMNEIYGEENFIANIIWKKKVFDNNDNFPALHEYLLLYCKNINNVKFNLLPRSVEQLSKYKNPDNDPKGEYYLEKLSVNTAGGRYSKATDFEIVNPITGERYSSPTGNWRFGKETIDEMIKGGRIDFSSSLPRYRVYLSEVKQGISANTWWDNCGQNLHGAKELKELFNSKVFDTPKPTEYIKRMIFLSTNKNDIILDFFSGSASTAHSLLKQNYEDCGKRKFILVQLEEEVNNKYYSSICDIAKERIRRAGEKIKEENKDKEGIEDLDIGFKVFRLKNKNELKEEEILYELILAYGFDLNTEIIKLNNNLYKINNLEVKIKNNKIINIKEI